MSNNTNDFRELAKKLLDQQNTDHETLVKSRIVPLLLGPYDSASLSKMEEVKAALKEAGFTNCVKLEDIPTEASFAGKLDLKFSHAIHSFRKGGYFTIPLFYFPKEDEKRLGHHAELVEIALNIDLLILLSSGLFYQEEVNLLHHKRMFLHQTSVSCLEEYKKEAIKHVSKFFPILEKKMMSSRQEANMKPSFKKKFI